MTTKIPAELSSTPGIADSSNATAITIDSSERVGIGTSSPGTILHTRTSDATSNNNAGGGFHHTSSATAGNRRAQLFLDADRGDFGTSSDGAYAYIEKHGDGGILNIINQDAADTAFQQGGSEKMRIASSGNVGIGTSSPSYTLDVSGGSGTMSRIQSGGSSTYFAIKNTSNTGYIGIDSTNLEFYPTGSKAATLQSNGNLLIGGTLTENYSFSDERLKENITVITDAIEKVKTLRGITFTRKQDKGDGTGLIAQELEKVLPQAVYEPEPQIDRNPITGEARGETPETYKAIHYGNTVGLLVEAIKEQQTIIDDLKSRIETLEG